MTDPDTRALDQLVARVRHAEQRAIDHDKLAHEVTSLRERVAADAAMVGELRTQVAAAKSVETALDAAHARIDRLLARVSNAERRRDAALVLEAEAAARLRALEAALAEAEVERDRSAEDLRRFRSLRWNRLGVALRRPINRVRALSRR